MKNEKSGSRLKEITAVLRKHELTRGITPEKLRLILEDLGPTFIKIGQIMSLHSDVLPKKYCDELMKLRSDVAPMPFSEVEEVIEDSYGYPWQEVFSQIEKETLGSASIAQVHRATLKTGEEVVVKVQRKGIYDTMARDIGLLHKAVNQQPSPAIGQAVRKYSENPFKRIYFLFSTFSFSNANANTFIHRTPAPPVPQHIKTPPPAPARLR